VRGGGDVPTCTVSEGSRDGAAFLNPEGKKTLLLTWGNTLGYTVGQCPCTGCYSNNFWATCHFKAMLQALYQWRV